MYMVSLQDKQKSVQKNIKFFPATEVPKNKKQYFSVMCCTLKTQIFKENLLYDAIKVT